MQLFQSANCGGEERQEKFIFFGWKPLDLLWLASALQFIGTLLFNINTFDAMLPDLTVLEENLLIWVPNIEGSILFLISGLLAFKSVARGWWVYKPDNIEWWCAFINLLGCIGFMCSALLSIFLPGVQNPEIATLALGFTLQGALCFLVGALLLLKT